MIDFQRCTQCDCSASGSQMDPSIWLRLYQQGDAAKGIPKGIDPAAR